MFCYQCGEKLADEASFCHACGTKVVGKHEPAVQHTPPQPVPHQSVAEKPVSAEHEVKRGTPYVVIGWVSFGLSLAFCLNPGLTILFGLIALVMGIMVINVRSQAHGIVLTILAVVGGILSLAIGSIINELINQSYYYNYYY